MDIALILGIAGSSLSALMLGGLIKFAFDQGKTNARLAMLEKWFWSQIGASGGAVVRESAPRLSEEFHARYNNRRDPDLIERHAGLANSFDELPDAAELARAIEKEYGREWIEERCVMFDSTPEEFIMIAIAAAHELRRANPGKALI